MATGRPEQRDPRSSRRAGKRAFAAASAVIATAAGVMLALGPPSEGGSPSPGRTVVAPPAPTRQGGAESITPAELRSVRAVATRFAVAFLARESGRFDATARRVLRSRAASSVRAELSRPPRATAAWRPPPSRFEAFRGLSETGTPGEVEATIAYRRGGERLYLGLLLFKEGGRWRVLPSGW